MTKIVKKRKVLCPICYLDVPTHFARHLERYHFDHAEVKKILSHFPQNKIRLSKIRELRKQGYFHLHVEKNITNPVRRSKNKDTAYVVCPYCLRNYSKKLLHRYVKDCCKKPDNSNLEKNCLRDLQTFMASATKKNTNFFKKLHLYLEVFKIMQADDISAVAKNDPLIILYGEGLINKHKRKQIVNVISNRIREIACLKISIKQNYCENLVCFFYYSNARTLSNFNKCNKNY